MSADGKVNEAGALWTHINVVHKEALTHMIDLGDEVMWNPGSDSSEAWLARRQFVAKLLQAADATAILLEIKGLSESRSKFIQDWAAEVEKDLGKVGVDREEEEVYSTAYDFLTRTIENLGPIVGIGASPIDGFQRDRLEHVLSEIPAIVEKRQIQPNKEEDIQVLMDELLAVYFPDYIRKFDIPSSVKKFKPDGGVKSLGVAIELKFCDSEQEVRNAISEIFEDVTAYGPTKDWTRFLAVIYQTGNFMSLGKVRSAFNEHRLSQWTPLVLVGKGGRKSAPRNSGEVSSNQD